MTIVIILAESVIKPMMNEFLQGQSITNKVIAIDKDQMSKNYKCDYCDKTSHSKSGLKNHITRMHKNQNQNNLCKKDQNISTAELLVSEDDESFICSTENDTTLEENSDEKKENRTYRKSCEFCDYEVIEKRKYKVVQQMLEHKNNCYTNKMSGKCNKCEISLKDSNTLKRHMRDVHKSTTDSTSPPPKKKKSSAKLDDTAKTMVENKTDTVEVVEDMDIEQTEEEIMAERSKNQDEKVLEKEKKNEEKELLYKKISEEKARKKKEEVENQNANKKLEKQKIKHK